MTPEPRLHTTSPETERRLPIVPFLELVLQSRRMILAVGLGAAVLAGAFSLIVPATYETTMTILPPESGPSFGMGGGGGGLESSLAMLQFGMSTLRSSDLYADMLRSRSVMRYTIDRLSLLEVYGLAKLDSIRAYAFAYGRLDEDIDVKVSNNGLITATVRAHTGYLPGPKAKVEAARRAAEIGNTLGAGLEWVNRSKNTSQARQARVYLEEQVRLTNERLDVSSRSLAGFQTEHMAVDLGEQMRVGIETAGKLEADAVAREVALGVALQSMQPDNPEVRRLQSEIGQFRRQLRLLQSGRSGEGEGDATREGRGSLESSLESLPEIGRRYAELLREVKVQEALYEMLTAQLYQARVKETEEVPVVQVLDEATIPAAKKSPLVRKTALIAGVLGVAFGVFIAIARDWWGRYPWRDADVRALSGILRR